MEVVGGGNDVEDWGRKEEEEGKEKNENGSNKEEASRPQIFILVATTWAVDSGSLGAR